MRQSISMRFRIVGMSVAAVLVSGIYTSAQATIAAIYNLGAPGTDTYSDGYAINNSGQVAGESDSGVFLYTGTPTNGGAANNFGDGGGRSINGSGSVAGYTYINPGPNYYVHAALYTGTPGNVTMTDLGTLGGKSSAAAGINASGRITGEAALANGINHAFLYTNTLGSGTMTDLGSLYGLGFSSQGNAINKSGQIAGNLEATNGFEHAFLYTGTPGNGGTMVDLGTLNGGAESYGLAINDSGQVAGDSFLHNGNEHAFLYSGIPGSGGTMADLGTLGGPGSQAYAVNALGQVVGRSDTDANGNDHLFLYVGNPGVDGHMIDLNAWLAANNPTEAAKWTLVFALGINDSGLITGYGNYDNGTGSVERAFLLDASALTSSVPEPTSLAILALCLPALLGTRRTRRA